MELFNSCDDIIYGYGPFNFNLTLFSDFPALSQYQFSDQLQVQLKLNFSHISKIPNQRTNSIDHNIIIVDISNTLHTQWTGGKSIQLAIDREEVPEQIMERIRSDDKEIFTAQVKLIFNGLTAGEWSLISESPIFSPCIERE